MKNAPGANQGACRNCEKYIKEKYNLTSTHKLKEDVYNRILAAGEFGIKKSDLDDRFGHLGFAYAETISELCHEGLTFIAYRKEPGSCKKSDYYFAL
jgi:hypothetical protein